jgi:quercetin dioxygenase-like cupin family protein
MATRDGTQKEATMTKEVRIGALKLKFLLDDKVGNGKATMFEMTVPEKAKVPAAHHHLDVDEIVYGLEGTLTMTVDGATQEVKSGDTVFVPRGTVHQFQNLHPGDARVLSVLTPGSIGTAYFEEMADVVNAGGPPDLAKMKDIMLRHGLVPAQAA